MIDFTRVVADVPQLRRGRVWCRSCGHSERVDSAHALSSGWPTHCGSTMTIDSPAEQARFAVTDAERTETK